MGYFTVKVHAVDGLGVSGTLYTVRRESARAVLGDGKVLHEAQAFLGDKLRAARSTPTLGTRQVDHLVERVMSSFSLMYPGSRHHSSCDAMRISPASPLRVRFRKN